MGVVERVPLLVGQPEPPAAELVPAHEAQRPSRDRDDRRAERREQVVAVMPAVVDVVAARAVRVDVRGAAVDREDVVRRLVAEPRHRGERLRQPGLVPVMPFRRLLRVCRAAVVCAGGRVVLGLGLVQDLRGRAEREGDRRARGQAVMRCEELHDERGLEPSDCLLERRLAPAADAHGVSGAERHGRAVDREAADRPQPVCRRDASRRDGAAEQRHRLERDMGRLACRAGRGRGEEADDRFLGRIGGRAEAGRRRAEHQHLAARLRDRGGARADAAGRAGTRP